MASGSVADPSPATTGFQRLSGQQHYTAFLL
jgi:hypothetical protein